MLQDLKQLKDELLNKSNEELQPLLEKEVLTMEKQLHVVMTTMTEKIVYLEKSNQKLTNYSIKLDDYIEWLEIAREKLKKLMSLPQPEMLQEAKVRHYMFICLHSVWYFQQWLSF